MVECIVIYPGLSIIESCGISEFSEICNICYIYAGECWGEKYTGTHVLPPALNGEGGHFIL